MKPSPGKLILWLMVTLSTLLAQEPYTWSVTSSKTDVVINEAVVLHYTCRFSDEGSLYTIDFRPSKKREGYRLSVLSEDQHIRQGQRVNEFVFLVFPTSAGSQPIDLTAMMRMTTRDSIENTVMGRDNVEEIDYDDVEVTLPPVVLQVSDVSTALVGTFTLDVEYKQEKVKAFEPLQVVVRVAGEGNLDELTPFEIKIAGVQVFAERPQRRYEQSETGYRGEIIQRFALVSDKGFQLEAFELRYFDVNDRRVRHLVSRPRTIEVVESVEREELLDLDEEEEQGWEWDWSYLNYLLTFLSGLLLGRWYRRRPAEKTYDESLVAKIKASRDVEALAMVLVINGDDRYASLILRLERDGARGDLVKAKRDALSLVDAEETWEVPIVRQGLVGRSSQLVLLVLRQLVRVGRGTIRTLMSFIGKR